MTEASEPRRISVGTKYADTKRGAKRVGKRLAKRHFRKVSKNEASETEQIEL